MQNIEGREYSSEDIQDLPPDYWEQVYTQTELGQLKAFENIIGLAHHCEESMANGNVWNLMRVDKDGKPRDTWIEGNSRFVNILRTTAWHMYVGHDVTDPDTGESTHVPGFVDSPKMLEYANDFLQGLRIEKETSAEFEKRELQHLYEVE